MNETKVPVLTPDRAMYEWLTTQSKYKGKKITQGFLRLLSQPLATQGSIIFNVLDDINPGAVAGEQRLPRSDAFWGTIFGFFIGKLPAGGNVRSLQEQSFPNPYVFTNPTELEALQTLYNGTLKIEIADRLYFQQLDLKRFKNAAVAQEGLEVSAGFPYGVSDFNPNTGFYEAVPHIELTGKSTPQIEITLPEPVNMAGAGGTTNYAIFYVRGFYIPDGAMLGGK